MYQYKYVDVEISQELSRKKDSGLERVKENIDRYSGEGWRLVQVIPVGSEKTGVYGLYKYTIIFEKEINQN